jgi:hypothetical protein
VLQIETLRGLCGILPIVSQAEEAIDELVPTFSAMLDLAMLERGAERVLIVLPGLYDR